MSQNTLLLYNNLLALPLMAAWTLLGTRELQEVGAYPRLWDPSFALFLFASCSQAFLLNLCIFRRAPAAAAAAAGAAARAVLGWSADGRRSPAGIECGSPATRPRQA